MIPNRFTFTAAYKNSERTGEYYQHFGIHTSLLSIYGVKPDELRTVTLEVIPEVNLENRKETNDVDYWGFWNNETERLSLIYPSYIQFAVCFPYGPKAEEEVGRGKCLNLKVVDVQPYSYQTNEQD